MYVAKLEISGVRGFHPPRTVNLDFARPGMPRSDSAYAGWTVLAGRNGSGKSTLLQCIALVLAGPRNGGQLHGVDDDWGVGGDGDEAVPFPQILLALHSSPEDEEITEPIVVSIAWDYWPGGDREVPAWGLEDVGSRYSLWKERTSGPWTVRPDRWFFAGYGPFRRLSGAQIGTGRSGDGNRAAAVRTLFDEDAALTEGVSWLVEQHLFRLEGKSGAQELLDTVLTLLGDVLLPDGFRIFKVDSDGLWVSKDGREFPLRQMSDGYRTVTALVVDIVRQMHAAYGALQIKDDGGVPTLPYPGVVLIDEIDAHLHVSWQKKIGQWLKAHFPRIQFIVTTHSPYICQSADPGGLIRLPGPDEQEPPHVVDGDLYRRVVYGSGDDAILTELFGMETPYSAESERLRRRVGDLEVKVLDGQASEAELAEYRELRETLTSSLAARVDEVAARLGREQ